MKSKCYVRSESNMVNLIYILKSFRVKIVPLKLSIYMLLNMLQIQKLKKYVFFPTPYY